MGSPSQAVGPILTNPGRGRREPTRPERCMVDDDRSEEGRRLDEADLIARARAGESAAYADLVAQHRPAALRVAALVLGDPAEAEDAVQEASVKAYAALARFRDGAPFRPWLLQIVANEARNRRRAAGRRADLARRAGDARRPFDERGAVARGGGARGRAAGRPGARARRPARGGPSGHRGALLPRAIRGRDGGRAGLAARDGQVAPLARARPAAQRPGRQSAAAAGAAGRSGGHSAEVRRAVADRLGLRGIEIVHTPFGPAPTATPEVGAGAARTGAIATASPPAGGPPEAGEGATRPRGDPTSAAGDGTFRAGPGANAEPTRSATASATGRPGR